ncbi:hypothetical protein OIU78_021203 [Salix suchowensis]|nr:hypothetical protein OIU78_021203 [Salix suchowensis]
MQRKPIHTCLKNHSLCHRILCPSLLHDQKIHQGTRDIFRSIHPCWRASSTFDHQSFQERVPTLAFLHPCDGWPGCNLHQAPAA